MQDHYEVIVQPIKTPYGWYVKVLLNGECFAWRTDAATQEEANQWAACQIENQKRLRVPNCIQCGKAISLDNNGICDDCSDIAYADYIDDMAERAYEEQTRQRLGW